MVLLLNSLSKMGILIKISVNEGKSESMKGTAGVEQKMREYETQITIRGSGTKYKDRKRGLLFAVCLTIKVLLELFASCS